MSSLSGITLGSALSRAETGNAPLPEGQTKWSSARPEKPNIVFILADDMGYGDIGALNYGASETPHIDALMAEGTLLTQHYAGSAVCTPSRACLLSGCYPQRVGVADTLSASGLHQLSLDQPICADYLRQAGYRTGIVGKWHLGWEDPRYRPQNRGFDEAIALEKTHHWNWVLDRNGTRENSDGRYLADMLTDESVGFLERNQNERFFLYLAHFAPHTPLLAPEEDIQPFRDKGMNENVSTLYGMIRRMDTGIGRVMETLKRLGLDRNTIVIFTSDNGPQFATSWEDRSGSTRYNCGFNGHKDLVYEGGIRVPAIVRWPDGLPGSRKIHDMAHFNDWTPTLLDMAGSGIPKDTTLDGRSMLPLLRGETNIVPPRRFWQYSRYYPTAFHNAAIRDGNWKLVRPSIGDVSGNVLGVLEAHRGIVPNPPGFDPTQRYRPVLPEPLAPQLFNLSQDPEELYDLSTQHPERLARMSTELDRWFEDVMRGIPA